MNQNAERQKALAFIEAKIQGLRQSLKQWEDLRAQLEVDKETQ